TRSSTSRGRTRSPSPRPNRSGATWRSSTSASTSSSTASSRRARRRRGPDLKRWASGCVAAVRVAAAEVLLHERRARNIPVARDALERAVVVLEVGVEEVDDRLDGGREPLREERRVRRADERQ